MAYEIRVGTRKSKLALKQTNMVMEALEKVFPSLQLTPVPFHTRGDKILDKPLWEIGNKGLFASEFEEMIRKDEIDIAVHSGKDLPLFLAEGLSILAVLERGDPRDVLVMPSGRKAEDCRIIGTGSLRRIEFAASVFPKAECKLIRGNVHTRLEKMMTGAYDGIILAKAGLDRLGIQEGDTYTFHMLSTEEFLPAACQGIIAVEGEKKWHNFLDKINHIPTFLIFETERKVLSSLNADCSEPVAVFAEFIGENIYLRAMYGKKKAEGTAPIENRLELAEEVVRRLR